MRVPCHALRAASASSGACAPCRLPVWALGINAPPPSRQDGTRRRARRREALQEQLRWLTVRPAPPACVRLPRVHRGARGALTVCPCGRYTNHEKNLDKRQESYGSVRQRLGGDSIKDWDCCSLSLQPCKDPVVTTHGVLFEREAIYEYILKEKKRITEGPHPAALHAPSPRAARRG